MLTCLLIISTVSLIIASDYKVSEPLYPEHSGPALLEIKDLQLPSWAEEFLSLTPVHEVLSPLSKALYPVNQLQGPLPQISDIHFETSLLESFGIPNLYGHSTPVSIPPEARLSRNRFARTSPPPPTESVSLLSPIQEMAYPNFIDIPDATRVEVALPQFPDLDFQPSYTASPMVPSFERILELRGTIAKIQNIRLEHQAEMARIRALHPQCSQMFDNGLTEMDFIFNTLLEPFQSELAKCMSERYGYAMAAESAFAFPGPQPEAIKLQFPEPQPEMAEPQEATEAIVLPNITLIGHHSLKAISNGFNRKRTNQSHQSLGPRKKHKGTQ